MNPPKESPPNVWSLIRAVSVLVTAIIVGCGLVVQPTELLTRTPIASIGQKVTSTSSLQPSIKTPTFSPAPSDTDAPLPTETATVTSTSTSTKSPPKLVPSPPPSPKPSNTPTEVKPTKPPQPTVAPTELPTPLNLSQYRYFDYGLITSDQYNTGIDHVIPGFAVSVQTDYLDEHNTLEFIPDPTGKIGGSVVHAVISSPPPAYAAEGGGAHRNYLEFWGLDYRGEYDKVGNFAIEFDLVVEKTSARLTDSGYGLDSWYSPSSFGVLCANGQIHMVGGVKLIASGGKQYFLPYTIDQNNKSHSVVVRNPVLYNYGDKVHMRVEVFGDENGKPNARFFQNEIFIGQGSLRPDARLIPIIVRGGGNYAGAAMTNLETFAGNLKLLK